MPVRYELWARRRKSGCELVAQVATHVVGVFKARLLQINMMTQVATSGKIRCFKLAPMDR